MNSVVILHPSAQEFPALIAHAGDRATLRFLEFFTVNIRNPNTRAAYGAASAFLNWCQAQDLTRVGDVQPVHVAAYIEGLQRERSAPTSSSTWLASAMLFDWLVIGQVIPANPAHAVRGPRHSVYKGSTPVRARASKEAPALLKGMDVSSVGGVRDRALMP